MKVIDLLKMRCKASAMAVAVGDLSSYSLLQFPNSFLVRPRSGPSIPLLNFLCDLVEIFILTSLQGPSVAVIFVAFSTNSSSPTVGQRRSLGLLISLAHGACVAVDLVHDVNRSAFGRRSRYQTCRASHLVDLALAPPT